MREPAPPLPAPARAGRRLRTALLVLLVADAGAAWVVLIGVFTLLQRVWLSLGGVVVSASIETHVAQLQAARRIQGLLDLATVAVFLGWIWRAHRNVRMLGVARLGFSPRAAVAAFLIPMVNLVAPVRVVRELWHASRIEDTERPWWEAGVPGVVTAWWACVLVTAVADPVWRRLAADVDSLAIGGPTVLFMVAQLTNLAAAVLGIAIVWTIDARQAEHFQALER